MTSMSFHEEVQIPPCNREQCQSRSTFVRNSLDSMSCLSDFGDATTLLLGALVALLAIWMFKRRRPKNFPPGPRGLPVVGYVPFLGKNPGNTLMKLKKQYGPVMSVQMGGEDWVVLNDFATINEALVKNSEKFSGRPSNYFFELIAQGNGLVTSDYGSKWKSLRKFGLMTLKGFGVGKKSMEENVVEEMNYLVESLENSGGDLPLRHKMKFAVSNIICRIVFGSRFEHEDERFKNLLTVMDNFFSETIEAKLFGLMILAPILRHFPIFRGALNKALGGIKSLIDVFQSLIDDHKKGFIEDDLRDFIDAFLKEIKEKGENDPSFNEQQLLHYIRDLFEAGTGTTTSTLLWSIFTLCHFPETQEKIAKEIHIVLGESGTVTMKHREQMPYTSAFIHEIMRVKTLSPLAIFHKTNEHSSLGGYDIPKNTTISPNLWAVHHDPETFPDPDSFRPERFLDQDGKFVKSSHVIPFSVGPRHCLGEQLARMEIFIFLTSIVQRLKISPDPNEELPPYKNAGASNGITFEGPDFKVIFEKR